MSKFPSIIIIERYDFKYFRQFIIHLSFLNYIYNAMLRRGRAADIATGVMHKAKRVS